MNGSLRKTLSELESANSSEAAGTDSLAQSMATSASTRASSVATANAAVSLIALSAASSAVAANAIALSAASSAATASASAAVADSKAVSVGTAVQAQNLGNMNVGSVQNSSANLRISTAGDYAIGNYVYTKAASSAVFTLAGTTLTSSQACRFLLALDSAGSGQVTQGNIAATSGATSLPATPAGQCPVAEVIVVAGASTFVPGTTTFSECSSATGSVVINQLLRR